MKLDLGDDAGGDAGLQEAVAEAEEIVQEYTVRRTLKPKKPRNEKLPAHLERYEVRLPVPDDVANCPEHGPRKPIGDDRMETLEFERPKLQVRVTLIPKFACESQPQCGVKEPQRPTGLVEGNRYDTSVAAEIITAKVRLSPADLSPAGLLRRLRLDAQSLDAVEHPRGRRVRAGSAGRALSRAGARQRPVIGTDDTTVTLLLPPEIPAVHEDDRRSRGGSTRSFTEARARTAASSVSARMWAYRSLTVPINVFDFTVSRHRDGPDEFSWRALRGKLLADCYSGYQGIALRSDSRIQRGACCPMRGGRSSTAVAAIRWSPATSWRCTRQLYDIEERGKSISADEREVAAARRRSGVARLREWLDGEAAARCCPRVSSPRRWAICGTSGTPCMLYLSDGRMPIDNNETEQLMKQVAIGRKNWLFMGSVAAGIAQRPDDARQHGASQRPGRVGVSGR